MGMVAQVRILMDSSTEGSATETGILPLSPRLKRTGAFDIDYGKEKAR